MVPLLAPASASLLPWVRREAETHSAPKFGHISPSWGPKNDSTGRPTTRAAGPDRRGEQRRQRGRRLGPGDRDAPGSEARCPGSSDTAAAGSGRKPTPLAGCRSPAAAGWSPRPPGSRHVPGHRHLNPSPTARNDPAAPAARSSPRGQRARNPSPQCLSTPRPPLPSPPPTQAVTRGQAAPGSDTRGRSASGESGHRQGEGRGGARMRAGWERPPGWEGLRVGRIPRRGCGPRPENPRPENVAFSTLSPPFVDTEAGVGLTRLLAGGVTPGNPLYVHLLPPSLRAFRVFFFPTKDHFAWIQ